MAALLEDEEATGAVKGAKKAKKKKKPWPRADGSTRGCW